MANRDLLKEAIADAKAVKEVAIANAKAALEEAFTPHLKDMLAQKINEMEDMDEEMDLAEVDKEKKMAEEKEMDEGYGKKDMDEAEDKMDEAEDMDEELDLEEILAELELDEEEDLEEYGGNIDPGTEPKSFLKKKADAAQLEEGEDVDEAKEEMKEEEEAGEEVEAEETEEEIDLEDMSEDDLKSFIEDVIEDMIEDGELVPGPNADESEAEEEEGAEAEGEVGDADVDVDVDLQEGKEELNEVDPGALVAGFAAMGAVPAMIVALEDYAEKNPGSPVAKVMAKLGAIGSAAGGAIAGGTLPGGSAVNEKAEEELKEANQVIKALRSDLNEVNLLNSKLLYTNKIFRNKNLTENQKIKVLKAFDKAETVKEAKAIFETLNENLVAKSAKSNIRESLGAASKPAGVAPKRNLNEGIIQEDAMVSRFKQLAGIK